MHARPFTLHSLLLYTALLLVHLSTAAKSSTPEVQRVESARRKRPGIIPISTLSPLAIVASTSADLVETTRTLEGYFAAVEAAVISAQISRNSTTSNSTTGNETQVSACNNRSLPWQTAVSAFADELGWVNTRRGRCTTDVHGANGRGGLTDDGLSETVSLREHAIHARRWDMIRAARLPGWRFAEGVARASYSRGKLSCRLEHASAARVDGHWFVTTLVTNHPRDEWVREGTRAYLFEFLRVSSGRLVSARMRVRPSDENESDLNGTHVTTVTSWQGGAAEPSQFVPLEIERNEALMDALEIGELWAQQVADAMTASNLAILALPLVASVIPLGLVAEVSRRRMAAYVLLSDLITGLPMWIKGAEVMRNAARQSRSSVTRIGDGRQTKIGEVWVATCGSVDGVGTAGAVLVGVASGMMLVGVLLEVVVVVWQKRRQRWHRTMTNDQNIAAASFQTGQWVVVAIDDDDFGGMEKTKH